MKNTEPKIVPLGTHRFSLVCWESNTTLTHRWQYIIVHFIRRRFKRSGREGWAKLGFITMHKDRKEQYETRKEAIKAGRQEVKDLIAWHAMYRRPISTPTA